MTPAPMSVRREAREARSAVEKPTFELGGRLGDGIFRPPTKR